MKIYFLAGILTIICVAFGCGGNSSATRDSHQGSLHLRVRWPATREIPAQARSIRFVVQLLQPETLEVLATAVVARTAGQEESSATIENLPSVRVRVTASAHASTDGSGIGLAEGSQDVTISASSTTPVSITLNGVSSRIKLGNVTDGEIQSPCGNFSIYAEWTDGSDGNPAVTWTVAGSEFYVEAPDQMRLLIPYSGSAVVTATLISDPTQKASATVHVDILSGIWDNGWRIQTPSDGTETHTFSTGAQLGTLTHNGSSFTGSFPSGIANEQVTVSGTVGQDTLTGTTTFMGNTTPFSATRMCSEWP